MTYLRRSWRPSSKRGPKPAGPLTQAITLLGGNPRYQRYFVARFSSVTGSTVAPLALAFAVLNAGGGATALGIGLAIGSVASLLLRLNRVGLIMCGAVVPEAFLLAGMAAGMPLPMIATAAVATGAAGTFQLITWNSFLQRWIPDQEFSRVTATSSTIATVLVPVAYAAVGPLTAAVGIRPVLWGCTAICLAAAMTSVSIADVRRLGSQ